MRKRISNERNKTIHVVTDDSDLYETHERMKEKNDFFSAVSQLVLIFCVRCAFEC